MPYAHTWISDDRIDSVATPALAHAVATYVSETNKTANTWSRVTDAQLTYTPHPKSNTLRQIFAHQILSERRFFAEFLGLDEPPADQLLPPGHTAATAPCAAYLSRYVDYATARLPALARAPEAWWLDPTTFFSVPRQRAWVFWRRVLHTAHHRTQVLMYLRLAGDLVPATYGPSGDETWDGADPTLA